MYAFNLAAIFSPGHPYIESTTVLSDNYVHLCRPYVRKCGRELVLLVFIDLRSTVVES